MVLITSEDEKFAEGLSEGANREKTRVVSDMLRENLSLRLIAKISRLSEDVIRGIAGNLGLSVK